MKSISKDEGAARLKFLYTLLPGLPAHGFDLDSWRHSPRDSQPTDRDLLRDTKELVNCGTSACAIGWAAAHPQFHEWGLRFVKGELAFRAVPKEDLGHYSFEWRGLAALFAITPLEAQYLFYAGDEGYPYGSRVDKVRLAYLQEHHPSWVNCGGWGIEDQREQVMARILTHLYLHEHISTSALKKAVARWPKQIVNRRNSDDHPL